MTTDFPEDHKIIMNAIVPLEWKDDRWVISNPQLDRDGEGVLCNYGLHLDDPDMRARCQLERDRAAVAAVPSRQTVAAVFEQAFRQSAEPAAT